MENFLIFYAPFVIVVVAIIISFWVAKMDGPVTKDEKE